MGDQIFGTIRVFGIKRDAEAGSETDILAFEAERDLRNRAHDTLCQHGCIVLVRIGHQHRKFITA